MMMTLITTTTTETASRTLSGAASTAATSAAHSVGSGGGGGGGGGNDSCALDAISWHETARYYYLMVLTPVILVTNLVVLFLLYTHKMFRRPDLFLIASLCCADMMVGAMCAATLVTRAREATLTGCLVRVGLSVTAVQASFNFLLAVASDRLLAITYGLRYSSLVTCRRTSFVIVLLWAFAVLFGNLPLLGWSQGEEGYHGYCSFLFVFPPSYVATSFVLALTPIATILFIHAYLYNRARTHIRKIDSLERVLGWKDCHWTLGLSGRSWRSVRTTTLVAGCVLTCWCPFLLTSLYVLIVPHETCVLKEVVGTHLLVLGYVNSALNPVVYAMRNRELKSPARTALAKLCARTGNT